MVYYDYAIVQATFNISSDVFMMMIPLPLILTVSVPIKQKLVLLLIFSMGIFVIVAATLTKIEFFVNIYDIDFMFWYTREASVAIYVANLPCIWPLLREALPVLRSWTPGFVSSGMYKRNGGTRRGTSTGPMTRGGVTTRTNVTRRSLEEFERIADPTRSFNTQKSVESTSRVREVRGGAGGGGGGGGYENSSRIEGDASSDSASDDLPIHGIRAQTTIELRVMGGADHEDGSRSRSLSPGRGGRGGRRGGNDGLGGGGGRARDGNRSATSSKVDSDYDLEMGMNLPTSSV